MIQEKDFLYRVPVKNALVTTPGQQVRNPEILVDVEGGEFMHGNILDANSTNKLINQSVKDAVDNKLVESGYVTKDLLEAETTRATEQENSLKTLIGAETSARTKGDEDLSSKIKAEQTRAEGKEKEISDKLAIVNGDSNTEGSFRKAIADVVAAAPENLDTLKEIADKLAQKADTTMLSEFIDKTSTEEQAINSPLHAKEYISVFHNTADGESGIKITNSGILAIDQLNENASPNKVFATDGSIADLSQYADATQLSNYVLTTALNQQVDTLNTAISAKQDAGNYIPYDASVAGIYLVDKTICVKANDVNTGKNSQLAASSLLFSNGIKIRTIYTADGITSNQHNDCLATSDGTFKPISDFVLKTELPTVPTKTSQLTNDSNFIQANTFDEDGYYLTDRLNFGLKNNGVMTIDGSGIRSDVGDGFVLDDTGITFMGSSSQQIPTAGGDFINISDLASAEDISNLTAGLQKKQNRITVNKVDVTDIETADITKLRTIVTNLINALSESGLINETVTLE